VQGGESDVHALFLDLPAGLPLPLGIGLEVHLQGPGLLHDVLFPGLEVLLDDGGCPDLHPHVLLHVQLHVLTHLLYAADELSGIAFGLDLLVHVEVDVQVPAGELHSSDVLGERGGEGHHVGLYLDYLPLYAQGVLPAVDGLLYGGCGTVLQEHRDL